MFTVISVFHVTYVTKVVQVVVFVELRFFLGITNESYISQMIAHICYGITVLPATVPPDTSDCAPP